MMSSKFRTILLGRDGAVATITLNRPDRMNSLNEAVYGELLSAFHSLSQDESTRVIVITGSGAAFCAGADLSGDEDAEKVLEDQPPESRRQKLKQGPQKVISTLYRLELPTIAMVNGYSIGAGFDLALACDMRIGCEHTRFAIGFTRLGLVPASGATWLLPGIVGMPKASEIIFTGRTIHPDEALQMGLLNKLAPAADLEQATMSLAQRIAEHPPTGVRFAKYNLRQGRKVDFEAALEMLAASQSLAMDTPEHKKALAAWRKRKPARED